MSRKIGCISLVVILVAVVVTIIVVQTREGVSLNFGNGKEEQQKDPYFEEARIGDLKLTVEATGSTEPITDIDVKSEATGRIIEMYVKEGDSVKAGDVICKLDQSNQALLVESMQIALDQARIRYTEAKNAQSPVNRSNYESALENARQSLIKAEENRLTSAQSYDRISELHTKGYATDQELENAHERMLTAEANVAAAEESLAAAELQLDKFSESSDKASIEQARLSYEAAKVNLEDAQKQLGDSIITSPINGIVLEKLLDVGDSVISINSAVGGGNTIVRVADMSKMQVRTNVDEIDIGKIETGQTATITVDTYFDREFHGVVTNIYPQGESTGTGLVSFIVIIEVDNSEGLLLGNMTANVDVNAKTIADALLIPLAATRAGEGPEETIVYKLKEGEDPYDSDAETTEVKVDVGETDYYDIVVLDGLEAGDMVKVRGFDTQIRFG